MEAEQRQCRDWQCRLAERSTEDKYEDYLWQIIYAYKYMWHSFSISRLPILSFSLVKTYIRKRKIIPDDLDLKKTLKYMCVVYHLILLLKNLIQWN